MARLTLLIADDDPVVRSMLGMRLEQSFDVLAAVNDAEEAVQAAGLRPDAAIIDVNMPGGGERAIRGICEASPETAIVVLSIDEEESLVRRLLQAGAMTFCRKGVGMLELTDLIERSVDAIRLQNGSAAVLATQG